MDDAPELHDGWAFFGGDGLNTAAERKIANDPRCPNATGPGCMQLEIYRDRIMLDWSLLEKQDGTNMRLEDLAVLLDAAGWDLKKRPEPPPKTS